jgi:hypothetical protein
MPLFAPDVSAIAAIIDPVVCAGVNGQPCILVLDPQLTLLTMTLNGETLLPMIQFCLSIWCWTVLSAA